MQRSISWLVTLFALAMVSPMTLADEKAKPAAEAKKAAAEKSEAELVQERFAEIAKQAPGVALDSIKTDKKGRILSCLVVGKARISTVLGTAKGPSVP